ncbi:hypothetical protein [Metabacillus malikii]|uniref:Uncharacterized protein n=1 Tax=Metabacillus malikii TaxID=1504265 RepID=A0ABT9ZHC9_9BACI|nr:hypothetical protein [Metabacillus malikii]MDQ0231677.1 hypothetical protein [Metabacillus malikii]
MGMNGQAGFTLNIIDFITVIINWSIILFMASRIYKKQDIKPMKRKVLLVCIIGLFSFSLHLNDLQLQIAILPLGVWLLFLYLKKKEGRWQRYRQYAWLGFCANYLFLAFALISLPINNMFFSKENPGTFLANIQSASVHTIHPSGESITLDKEKLRTQLSSMKQEGFFSSEWYSETYIDESNKRDERFPYELIDASAKWGSGIVATIYIEDDGRGLLVTTSDDQVYFRSAEPFIEEVN